MAESRPVAGVDEMRKKDIQREKGAGSQGFAPGEPPPADRDQGSERSCVFDTASEWPQARNARKPGSWAGTFDSPNCS